MTTNTGEPRTAVERVAAALGEHREVTAAEVAAACGLGQSTVGKALTALEADGRAVRTAGGRDGRRRLPDRWSPPSPAPTPPTPAATGADVAAATPRRLGRGQLRTLVWDALRAADGPVGAVGLARALGRSAGATGNALETLCQQGVIVRVSDTPRRYRPAEPTPTTT